MNNNINSTKSGVSFIPKDYDPILYKLRHSTAHIMAWATQIHFASEGPVLFGMGPAIQDGFYYDFKLPRSFYEEDLLTIEKIMRELLENRYDFIPMEENTKTLNEYFQDQIFKKEIIQDILKRDIKDTIFTTYTVGDFKDLCRGPHVKSTDDIDIHAFKLLSFSSAYWKGDNTKETLVRIYGTVWKTPKDLEDYLWQRAEAEKRDHRKLGKQLALYHFDETSPGAPYWLPNGLTIFHELLRFCRKSNKKNKYQEISSPLINRKSLWETSGHWEFYRDDMYLVTTHENCCNKNTDVELALKPMNCPNAMVVFNIKRRSYRDLPLRLSDCDMLHRNEASGALHGLLRVRQFHQDDAHIFLKKEQIAEECQNLLNMCRFFYSKFNMQYTFRLGTRPEAFIGKIDVWDKAENTLISILDNEVGREKYIIATGEGAFYGPKIDILMQDSLKRTWQMGTIQLDFQLPERFSCQYVDEDGSFKTPVVIHRAIYGSLERFIGVLIEHTNGHFPLWLAPIQVAIIPIADRHIDFCREKAQQLEDCDIRYTIDERAERMNMKIREAEIMKIPYALVIGDKEIEQDAVSCRNCSTKSTETMPFSAFLENIKNRIDHEK